MSDLRGKVKKRLSLPNDSNIFDDDLDDFISESIDNLYPIVSNELTFVTYTLPMGDNTINLDTDLSTTTAIEEVDYIEIYDSEYSIWVRYKEFTQHGRVVNLYGDFTSAVDIRVYGLGRYTIATLPQELTQVVINWAMSEFYSYLIGNSSKYNQYMQSSGARKVDNMQDVSDYYLVRGNQILADRAKIRGK